VAASTSAIGAILTLGARAVGQPEVGIALSQVFFRVCVAVASAGIQIVIVSLYRQLVAVRSGT
jgi:hydrogenase/urease accessory protein HupE